MLVICFVLFFVACIIYVIFLTVSSISRENRYQEQLEAIYKVAEIKREVIQDKLLKLLEENK